MTYKDFLKDLESKGVRIPKEDEGRYATRYASGPTIFRGKLCLINSWCVGGMRGGSCWGDKPSSYSTGEPEPEWSSLDQILELYAPGITFLQYKRLMASVENTEDEEGDYYGNSSVYSMRILPLETLYEFLSEKGFLPE